MLADGSTKSISDFASSNEDSGGSESEDYLPITGGTITGNITVNGNITANKYIMSGATSSDILMGDD